MLDDVKLALRITNTAYDGEVQDLIAAAELDLSIAGVNTVSDDALIKRAIVTYCKSHFGFDNPDADRLNDAYIMLKQHLSLSGDYNALD